MATPQARSVNAELEEGMSDGSYKKVIQNRGGVVELTFWEDRRELSVKGYGVSEAQVKGLGDGRVVRTPLTVPTRDPEALGY